MGALGQYPKEEMLRRLKSEVDRWEKADPSRKVQPALHLIAVVAQEEPGNDGKVSDGDAGQDHQRRVRLGKGG